MELFEGNFSNGIIADNNHGNNPLGTGFRNRFTATDDVGNRTVFRLPVNLQAFGRAYNFVGNILGTSGIHTVYQATKA